MIIGGTMSDHYAVFGNPVGHSKSPAIHAAFARQTGEAVFYHTVQPEIGDFDGALHRFIESGALGCNVTVPFKVDAFNAATERSPKAEAAGASNCLKFEDGRIVAENFDGVGLLVDIQDNLGVAVDGKRVLLLGAGGATRGVVVPFLEAGAESVTIANRTEAKAHDLAAFFDGPVSGGGFADLSGQSFDIVVNGTSAGLSGARLDLPDGVFAPGALAYEMVYGQGLTAFLGQARDAGAATLADGAGMLVEQAAEAFRWWRGVRPETAAVIDEISVPLE